jgi:hypothetical protein
MRSLIVTVLLYFLPALGGCVPVIPSPGMMVVSPAANLEDPDKYQVDPAGFPTFRIKERFDPPRWKSGTMESKYPMTIIKTADVWKVTHVVNNLYLIYSDTYNDRQCRLLAQLEPSGIAGGRGKDKCYVDYLYHVAISPDGTVRGGWKLLKNPERFIFARDRYRNMQIDPTQAADWGPQPLFELVR